MPLRKTPPAAKTVRALAALGATALAALLLSAGEMKSPPPSAGGGTWPAGSLRSLRLGVPLLRVTLPAKEKAAPPAAPALPAGWGDVYSFPNPARGVPPTVHVEAGGAERVLLSFYDAAGDLAHRVELAGPPALVDDGAGPEPAFEYAWAGAKPGVYLCRVTAYKDGREANRKTLKVAVLP